MFIIILECSTFFTLTGIYFSDILRISRRANNFVQCVFEKKKHLFHNDISPQFKFVLTNERLDFCDKKKKIKRINNADSFSQPSLVIFTKGADIFGHGSTYIHTYKVLNQIWQHNCFLHR